MIKDASKPGVKKEVTFIKPGVTEKQALIQNGPEAIAIKMEVRKVSVNLKQWCVLNNIEIILKKLHLCYDVIFHVSFLQEPEPEEIEERPVALTEGPQYRHDGYIELVLKVMARMCDGQNHDLQVIQSNDYYAMFVLS